MKIRVFKDRVSLCCRLIKRLIDEIDYGGKRTRDVGRIAQVDLALIHQASRIDRWNTSTVVISVSGFMACFATARGSQHSANVKLTRLEHCIVGESSILTCLFLNEVSLFIKKIAVQKIISLVLNLTQVYNTAIIILLGSYFYQTTMVTIDQLPASRGMWPRRYQIAHPEFFVRHLDLNSFSIGSIQ